MNQPLKRGPVWGCIAAAALSANVQAQAPKAAEAKSGEEPGLTDIPFEDLLQKEVSILGRDQRVAQTAAAVHVISNEDIRRSGATSIPEALRMSPGLNVARIDSSRWAVSSRGFNDFFANKLLVLMDGRSVYTPLFSGVFWDVQDTMLEDIDQIEIIRGPGASIWGANAVNGVINIVSKNSKDTHGTLITGGGGTEERGFGAIRYGAQATENVHYRAYLKYFNRDDTRNFTGGEANDEWDMYRGGFRTDWDISKEASLRFQGDLYTGAANQTLLIQRPMGFPFVTGGRTTMEGGNLLSSYHRTFSADSDMTFQVYYDRTERLDLVHHEQRDTYDVDFQHRFQLFERNSFTWGLGYRLTSDEIRDGRAGSGSLIFPNPDRNDQLASGFAQDEITIVDNVTLTIGAKLEHNDYTGFEFQPSGRLLWNPTEGQAVWGAVSRAVRTPSRAEHDINGWVPSALSPFGINARGSGAYESEDLIAYEIGYRLQATEKLSFDFAAYFNDYENLQSIVPAAPLGTFVFANETEGETYGFEVGTGYQVTKNWRVGGSYTLLQMDLETAGIPAFGTEGSSPQHQFQVRSLLDLPHNFEFDTMLYWVDTLPARAVSSYFKLDARLGWKPWKNEAGSRFKDLEFSVVGQNLIEAHHREFGPGFLISPTEIERSVYAKATWRF